VLLAIAGEAPQQRGPDMPVRLHETRQHEHAGAVDDFSGRSRKPAANRSDRTVAHEHVAARDVADVRIHRQDVGVADQKFAAVGHRVSRLLPKAAPPRDTAQGSGG
jgi:hypothetical protein